MDEFLAYPLDQKNLTHQSEMASLAKFRRALRREDQEVLDDLMASVKQLLPLHSLADHMTPLEFMLLTMLLEQKKEIETLMIQIANATNTPVHPPFP